MTKATKPAEPRQEPTIEQHAARQKVPAWQAAALKARHGWPVGKRISETAYKVALKAMLDGHTDGRSHPTEKAEKGGDE